MHTIIHMIHLMTNKIYIQHVQERQLQNGWNAPLVHLLALVVNLLLSIRRHPPKAPKYLLLRFVFLCACLLYSPFEVTVLTYTYNNRCMCTIWWLSKVWSAGQLNLKLLYRMVTRVRYVLCVKKNHKNHCMHLPFSRTLPNLCMITNSMLCMFWADLMRKEKHGAS